MAVQIRPGPYSPQVYISGAPPELECRGPIRTTPRGFEPLRAEPSGFLVHLLNHSDTVSVCVCFERAALCVYNPPFRSYSSRQRERERRRSGEKQKPTTGIEPATFCLRSRRSTTKLHWHHVPTSVDQIQTRTRRYHKNNMRRPGIEPGPSAWKADILTTRPMTRCCVNRKYGKFAFCR